MPVTLSTKTSIIISLYCFFSTISTGQNTYQFGLMPSINLNKKYQNNWGLNFKAESRHCFSEGSLEYPAALDYQYVLTDFAVIGSKKIGFGKRLTAGYLLRLSSESPVHRFIQQYIITQQMRSFRISHRIATDQTVSFSESPEFRLRYRIASEIPLNGQSTDPKEFYVKLNNEYLGSIQLPNYYWEVRLIPMLGYALSMQS